MKRGLLNSLADAVAGKDEPVEAPKLTEFHGAKCKACGCRTVFVSRPKPLDIPFKLIGLVPCRCGSCLNRFYVGIWRRRPKA